jgi:hypothetical protein
MIVNRSQDQKLFGCEWTQGSDEDECEEQQGDQ